MKIIRSLTLKETVGQTDQHLISLSSKTYVLDVIYKTIYVINIIIYMFLQHCNTL